MSIFDLPGMIEDDFETMTIEKAVELVGLKTGLRFFLDEKHFKKHYSAKKDGFYITIGFSINYKGERFLDTQVDYKTGGYGTPAISIDDCARSIMSYMDREGKNEKESKNDC